MPLTTEYTIISPSANILDKPKYVKKEVEPVKAMEKKIEEKVVKQEVKQEVKQDVKQEVKKEVKEMEFKKETEIA
jgi:hypothetical protein